MHDSLPFGRNEWDAGVSKPAQHDFAWDLERGGQKHSEMRNPRMHKPVCCAFAVYYESRIRSNGDRTCGSWNRKQLARHRTKPPPSCNVTSSSSVRSQWCSARRSTFWEGVLSAKYQAPLASTRRSDKYPLAIVCSKYHVYWAVRRLTIEDALRGFRISKRFHPVCAFASDLKTQLAFELQRAAQWSDAAKAQPPRGKTLARRS